MGKNFFDSIVWKKDNCEIESVIAVVHLNEQLKSFLKAITSFAEVAAILPKSSSKNPGLIEKFNSTYHILDYTREEIIANKEIFLAEIINKVGSKKFAIIDMGGYFSHVYEDLQYRFRDNFKGIVEDTENGHQKYEIALKNRLSLQCNFPVISVARSSLKDPEDTLVGQAIVFSAEAIFRSSGFVFTGKQILVVGFGKIGKSIASSLKSRGLQVDVYDIDPIRLAAAFSLGFYSGQRNTLLSKADVIFCATGNKAIGLDDFRYIKNETFLFCATSSDDELMDCLRYECQKNSVQVTDYVSLIRYDEKQFFVGNKGNAINFIHGGVVGDFIELIQAEIIFALGNLSTAPRNVIFQLPNDDKKFIAQEWVNRQVHFGIRN
jgi:adenosylhomocysteinase